tara:strand:- start:9286 stop:10632 length:1347 start_codon:yes stop_codon:yes gene_type:complete
MGKIMKPFSLLKKLPKLPRKYGNKINISELDKEIFSLSKSSFLNFAMTPIIGAVDTYWISRLNKGSMLAGQGNADRLFNSFFSIASFAPSVITPLISRYHAFNDKDNMIDTISTSVFLVGGVGSLITLLLIFNTKYLIETIIPKSSPSYIYACQYFRLRALGFMFALLNSLAFATMRGQKDLKTPMRINMYSQLSNAVLDPILMCFMGIRGVALGTILSEFLGFFLFYSKLYKDRLIDFTSIKCNQILKIIKQGCGVQVRSMSITFVHLLAARKIQRIDVTDTLATAHVLNIQLFELGFMISYSYGLISSILVPRYKNPIQVQRRIYNWGFFVSGLVGLIHIFSSRVLLPCFTSDPNVLLYTKALIPIGAMLQSITTFTCINEGISQGHQMYRVLGSGSFVSFTTFFLYIRKAKTIEDIWVGLVIASAIRSLINLHYINLKNKKIKDN